MNVVEYKGYQGSVEYDDGRLILRLLHISDFISTECESAREVQASFEALVEEYLEDCKKLSRKPNRPFKGSFNVRVSPELHKRAAMAATLADISLNAWVSRAIESHLSEPRSVLNIHQGVAWSASSHAINRLIERFGNREEHLELLRQKQSDLVEWIRNEEQQSSGFEHVKRQWLRLKKDLGWEVKDLGWVERQARRYEN
jgi:predicted HicB family RNase H-like nuclease